MQYVSLALSVYLGSILFVSGLAKLNGLRGFQATLFRHGILPTAAIPLLARLLPVSEVVLAGFLVVGLLPVAAAVAALVLFGIFLLTEVALLARRKPTACGCYGVAFPLAVDKASIAASFILVSVAALNVVAASYQVSAVDRRPVDLICVGIYALLACRVLWRRLRGRAWMGVSGGFSRSQG